MASVKVFSYGSNGIAAMRERFDIEEHLSYKPAMLENHVRIFAGYSPLWEGAVASVYPHMHSNVHGLVVEVSKDVLEQMDEYEGYQDSEDDYYTRKIITVKELVEPGTFVDTECFIYLKSDLTFTHLPSRQYCECILDTLNEGQIRGMKVEDVEIHGFLNNRLYHIGKYNSEVGFTQRDTPTPA
eukprot:755299-Hanusia_phi.AAC.6